MTTQKLQSDVLVVGGGLAGIVTAIEVGPGAKVSEGDLIITLEAMKMCTAINAIGSGTVTAIHVKIGEAVEEGRVLYTIG